MPDPELITPKMLIEAAYPIEHDEGCYLHYAYGENNFSHVLEEFYRNNPDTEEGKPRTFCNCGVAELNAAAEQFITGAETD